MSAMRLLSRRPPIQQPLRLLVTSVLLGACVTHPYYPGGARRIGELRFNTHDAKAVQQPGMAQALAGDAATTASAATTQATTVRLARIAPLALLLLKSDEEVDELELLLLECAKRADAEVNERWYRAGKIANPVPDRNDCRNEVEVEVDGCPTKLKVSRAMGLEKHKVALECARKVLDQLWPGAYLIEPRYRYYPNAKFLELVSAEEEQRLLAEGCTRELWRTIKPDIVLHLIGNPLRGAFTYEFKFPCPSSNGGQWTNYGLSSAYNGSHQGDTYQQALGGEVKLLWPKKELP